MIVVVVETTPVLLVLLDVTVGAHVLFFPIVGDSFVVVGCDFVVVGSKKQLKIISLTTLTTL